MDHERPDRVQALVLALSFHPHFHAHVHAVAATEYCVHSVSRYRGRTSDTEEDGCLDGNDGDRTAASREPIPVVICVHYTDGACTLVGLAVTNVWRRTPRCCSQQSLLVHENSPWVCWYVNDTPRR